MNKDTLEKIRKETPCYNRCVILSKKKGDLCGIPRCYTEEPNTHHVFAEDISDKSRVVITSTWLRNMHPKQEGSRGFGISHFVIICTQIDDNNYVLDYVAGHYKTDKMIYPWGVSKTAADYATNKVKHVLQDSMLYNDEFNAHAFLTLCQANTKYLYIEDRCKMQEKWNALWDRCSSMTEEEVLAEATKIEEEIFNISERYANECIDSIRDYLGGVEYVFEKA